MCLWCRLCGITRLLVPNWGFPSIQHNEVRDITASVLKRVCPNVSIESHLQPITGELFNHRTAIKDEQAHLDVAADGVWDGCLERTFVDVRVFNPFASTNRPTPVSKSYNRHEMEKWLRHYEQRIHEVEHVLFVPAVFAATGGMSKCCTALYKRIASLISAKSTEPYSMVMAQIRCRLSFALLRASVVCLRGARCPVC